MHDHLNVSPFGEFLYLLYLNKLSKHAICCLRSIPVSYAVFYAHCTVKALIKSTVQHFYTNNKSFCKFKRLSYGMDAKESCDQVFPYRKYFVACISFCLIHNPQQTVFAFPSNYYLTAIRAHKAYQMLTIIQVQWCSAILH